MKKILTVFAAALLLAACGNNNEGADAGNAPESPTTPYTGVENVNGNIPDTAATGAEPNTNMHSDSAQ